MIGTPLLLVFIAAIGTTAGRVHGPREYFSEPSNVVNPDYARGTHETKRSVRDVSDFDECTQTGLCENPENYPTELANRLIAQLDDKVNLLSMDGLPEGQDVSRTPGINTRIGSGVSIPVCSSYVKIVYPFQGKNKKGETRTILNRKQDPIQGFKVELCSKDAHYESNIVTFDEGWGGKCVQSYIYRVMVVIENNKEIVKDEIEVASACSCYGYMTD